MVTDRGPASTRFLAISTPRPRIPDTRMSHWHSFLIASWPSTYLSQRHQTHALTCITFTCFVSLPVNTCMHMHISTAWRVYSEDVPYKSITTNWYFEYCYFTPCDDAEYCDQRVCMAVCLSICLSVLYAGISQIPRVQISPNFLYMLPMTLARSSSDGNAMSYALLLLWMRSCFYII